MTERLNIRSREPVPQSEDESTFFESKSFRVALLAGIVLIGVIGTQVKSCCDEKGLSAGDDVSSVVKVEK